jgi:hypothetical protein
MVVFLESYVDARRSRRRRREGEKVRRSFLEVAEKSREVEVTYESQLVRYALPFLVTLIKIV